ncbi:MAG: UDP-N-acetylglucosamine--N-acetylmuramyl-(pentapeptide) pyrophosphoryl-undecaprenol N-acetylglucosamine transferase [SAR86 cluster bacterium]|jgi:UDP-N-acetylglucosamine--N-acetylmuramyl-(pentapeptide) pyrophosphoryl-undecaprenol N-acetylglucosamine transferase|nr:UDP-N-acetylglucosamine--N-acetylmuramyl-(pentapeptide) pyrophosphoryl-undecaprenol N-acetylglucosamine transferase [SAR86 cluster bacterium]
MKILVSAAKTGGHIFPAIAVGHEISKLGHDVIFMGSGEPLEVNALKATNFKYFISSMEGFRGKNFFAKIKSLSLIPISVFRTIKIIRNEKIDAMVGFGGFVTVPIGLAFFIARKPVFTHEQNSILGSANKFLSKISSINFTAFPLKTPIKNNIVCGNPIRENFKPTVGDLTSEDPIRIYITGGSQGAEYINTNLPKSLNEFKHKVLIKHQCGKDKKDLVINLYKQFKIEAEVSEFYDNPEILIEWSDFVISRSGALTISEVTSMSRGILMIPLPSAIDNHQFHNAKYIEEINMGLIHEEKDNLKGLTTRLKEILDKKTYNEWKKIHNNNHHASASNIATQVIENINIKK